MNIKLDLDEDLTKYPTIRKDHVCHICNQVIPTGTKCKKVSGRWDKKLYAFYEHLEHSQG